MFNSILEAIGQTPMLRLAKLDANLPGNIWIKLENRNPGGSIKDRIALHLLRESLKSGLLQAGSTVIEATSGNMGIGLALVSKALGLKAVMVMPESMSIERRKLMTAYGAEVVLTNAAAGMKGAIDKSMQLAADRHGFIVGQFTNTQAPQAHYLTTGPEIYNDFNGEVAALVAGVGSGSSLMGTGLYLKERIADFRMIAVEPASSAVLSGKSAGAHAIQGIGAGFIPAIVDVNKIDEVVTIENDDAINYARTLLAVEGVNAGISTGANVCAALRIAARADMAGKNIVTFACDGGERYLSTELFS